MTDPEHGRGDDQQNDEEDRGGVRATVITMMLRHGCAPYGVSSALIRAFCLELRPPLRGAQGQACKFLKSGVSF